MDNGASYPPHGQKGRNVKTNMSIPMPVQKGAGNVNGGSNASHHLFVNNPSHYIPGTTFNAFHAIGPQVLPPGGSLQPLRFPKCS